ncbi:MAG: cupin domain-containing protein [Bdellovibrionales bacterium]
MKIDLSEKRIFQPVKSQLNKEVVYGLGSVLFGEKEIDKNDCFFHMGILEPGQSSSREHFHSEVDEYIFVLEGRLELIEDSAKQSIQEWDMVLFEKNSKLPHLFKNSSDKRCKYLLIRKNIGYNDTVYP